MKKIIALTFMTVMTSAMSMDVEPGMWGIDEELNGKPGRGIQLDQQAGDLMIVTYFGYRPDGSALFLQSSGAKVNNSFEGQLSEYSGGTALGKPRTTGEFSSTPGSIQLKFSSETSGTVILPGETEKKISRLSFEDHSKRFTENYFNGVVFNGGSAQPEPYTFKFALADGQFSLDAKSTTSNSHCKYIGTYVVSGSGIISNGKADCAGADSTTSFDYKTGVLIVSKNGVYKGDIYFYSAINPIGWQLSSNHMGVCSSGISIGYETRCAEK